MRNPTKIILSGSIGALLLSSSAFAQQLFWTHDTGFPGVADEGAIWTWDLADGPGAQTELIGGLNRPIGVAAAGGFLYWAEDGVGGVGARIARANLDGTGVTTLFDGPSAENAQDVVVRGNTLYWTTVSGGVFTGNADGSGSATSLGGIPGLYTPLDVHDGGDHIFYGAPAGEDRGLYRMDLNGDNDQLVVADLTSGDWTFNTIAVNQLTGQIFYGNTTTSEIRRVDHDGSNDVLVQGSAWAVMGISVFGNTIYYSGRFEGEGVLGRVNTDGTGWEQLASGLPTSSFGIAVVPEPGAYAAILALVTGLLVFIRRRFRT